MQSFGGRARSGLASLVVALLGVVGVVVPVGAAQAASEPTSTDEAIVTADALPTVQIDGVVWDQVIVGNTVYVTGDFTTARPAGAAPDTQTVPRAYLLAYDLRTGELLDSWAPTLNGPGYAIAASPDGSRIYVGGEFSTINGAGRNRFAVLNATTGALITTFTGGANAAVRSISANATQVFIGGAFTIVAGQDRPRLASFDATTGALRSWRVSVQPWQVDSVALSPDGTRLFVAGRFERIGGVANPGMGAVSTSTGAVVPWAANKVITNSGYNAGITSISTDGQLVYGTGFAYNSDGAGYGNLEGSFAADPATGQIRWIADCKGDTYSLFPNPGKGTVFVAGHPHNCGNLSEYPEASPRIHRYALAFTKDARSVTTKNAYTNYFDFGGTPAPALRTYFPDFVKGTYTGQFQATWDVTGNGQYVAYAGEFIQVNGVGQQGLARFTTRENAPNKQGPRVAASSMTPVVRSLAARTVQLSWPSNWDRDDEILTYRVLRGSTVVHEVDRASSFWHLPRLSFTDTGLAAGTSYSYRVQAVDSTGNAVTSGSVGVTTASSGSQGDYATEVLTDNPSAYWRMGDSVGDFRNWTGHTDAGSGLSLLRGEAGAIAGDSDRAARFTGSDSSRVYAKAFDYSQARFAPNRFSVEAWFKTTSASGGQIIGLGSTAGTGNSTTSDRHVYMGADGRLTFGVRPMEVRTITSPLAYNDGRWHHVVATLGRAGMRLYVDGVEVASNAKVTSAQMANGYWRIGGDDVSAWPEAGGDNFVGTLDEVAAYGYALPAVEVARHNQVGRTGSTTNALPTASFTEVVEGLQVQVDGSGSSDPDGSISRYDWDFGDGTTATGVTASHTYAAAGTYTVKLTVTDGVGGTGSTTREVTVTVPNAIPTASFSEAASGLEVEFDGSASADSDGTISRYAWSFGDGSTADGVTASHTYAAEGTYEVTLTVTDDAGATGTATRDLTVALRNTAPTASFTSAASGLQLEVDGSASADPDGSISRYDWTFGDGSSATGATASHTYATGGTFTVTLTVTDNRGGTGTTSRQVTVAKAVVTVAADLFERSVASGLGTADVGGTWLATSGASVSSGGAQFALGAANVTVSGRLPDASASAATTRVTTSFDKRPNGSGVWTLVRGRITSGGEYRLRTSYRSDGSVVAWLVRTDSTGKETTVGTAQTVPGVTYSAGTRVNTLFEVSGAAPTTLRAKIWLDGQDEPSSWLLQATDSTSALQTSGHVGLAAISSSTMTNTPVVVRFDDLEVVGTLP